MNGELVDNSVAMQNTAVIANMIEVAVEVLCKIELDLIEVGNSQQAKEDLAEAVGAAIYTNILKESGV